MYNDVQDINEFIRTLDQYLKVFIGKRDYLFLVNDSNNEILQHYDKNYKNRFNEKTFRKYYQDKKEYFDNLNIDYHFYIVPDKSVVCRKLLPFTSEFLKRDHDKIKDISPDFNEILTPLDYNISDSHINHDGATKMITHMISEIFPQLSVNDVLSLIEKNTIVKHVLTSGDLLLKENWSYSLEKSEKYSNIPVRTRINIQSFKKLLAPSKFYSKRELLYYHNFDSFSNKKILVLRDSSAAYFINSLMVFGKEILFYWDYWKLNKELIDWFKPDIVLEIRTERFLENKDFA
ncbi:MAG: hypothetical protein Q4Q23_05905 [Methanobacteriaceae archaeon]|nr:hypothetical protein [Methanobacteriaceae archaeon]